MRIAHRPRRLALRRVVLAVSILWASGGAAVAQPTVPPELRGWEEWVVQGHEVHRCPWLVPGRPTDDARVCAWPSTLELQSDEHAARFSQRWETAIESWVPLPGSAENWPEDVTVDGSPAAVVEHDGTPSARVAPGVHSLAGLFRWTRRPGLLALPRSVALVSLSIDGAPVINPQRSEAGIVLGAHAVARQDDRVGVRVFRRLDDDLPALLTTRIRLVIAGEAREIRLPAALPEGFIPMAIDSELAAWLDPDNTLRVQVRPGAFSVTLEARGPSPLAEVRLGQRAAPWPAQEFWSFRGEDRLRVAAVEGVPAVDPAQADVPQEWRDVPAYRVNAAATLRVVERGRGLSAADANDLQLTRTAWLDFSGRGYTLVDTVRGSMRHQWRLDISDPYSLRSAHTGTGGPLLVTSGGDAGLTGVELRAATVDLTAVARVEHAGGTLPATGWRTRFTGVSGRLVVAPGYRLLAALGPDSAPQAWLERWSLLDIFVVLLTATVAWRIFGLRIALIAFAASVLTYQESGAPTWLWLAALVVLALQRAAPEGRLHLWARRARMLTLLVLLVALVPFAVTQVRLAVYPQLEALAAPGVHPVYYKVAAAPSAPAVQTAIVEEKAKRTNLESPAQLSAVIPTSGGGVAEQVVTSAARRAGVAQMGYEPGAVVQAGPGVPDWSYHIYPYAWSGAVEQTANARFVISPPWMTRLWRVLGLVFSALFLLQLTPRQLPALPGWWRAWFRPGISSALLLGAALACGANPTVHAATTPDPTLIAELRTQLLAPPKCSPDCAAVLAADVSATGARLVVVLHVSALDAVGLALPGSEPNWAPDVVQVDGAGPGWVQRSSQGIRYVSLTRGHHVVRIEGPLGAIDALSLAFPTRPHVIDVHAPDWDAGGVNERHLMSGALELARKRSGSAAPNRGTRQEEFPPFVAVARLFHFSHDWTINTTVIRVAPRSAAFTVNVPLLAAEAVTTPGLRASGGSVSLGLAVGQNAQAFTSILPRSDVLELVATRDNTHSERWSFEVGPTWHADFSGIPAVLPEGQTAVWIFEYYPRPGERLEVKVTRPAASLGGTLAFDNVTLQTVVGKRSSDNALELHYRSTQGGRQILRIPVDAVVSSVLGDGEPLGVRPERGELSLSALPGAHTWAVNWQTPAGVQLITRSPSVVLAAPSGNLLLSMSVPQDRWVLYAFGSGVGPTILYWSELLVFIVAAWWIGRSALTPLPAGDWLLLGLGLSTFSWFALGVFAAFVALFQWRARHAAPAERQRFNLLQLLSAFIAIVALLAVVAAVPQGLLARPDMRIEPVGNAGELTWFVDQAAERLPTPGVLSISLWWYKLAMLAWALWLSFALTRWTRWAWGVFTRDGLWRGSPPTEPPAVQRART